MEAAVAEAQPGSGNEVAHRARHDGFAWFGDVRNPRRDMHRDATDIVRLQLDLAGVEAAPHCDAEWPHRVGDRRSATHRAGWSVKSRQKPVAKIFDLLSAKADELLAHRIVVPVEQSAPLAVAQFGGAFGRTRQCR